MDETKEEQSISINDVDYYPVTNDIRESIRVQRAESIRQHMLKRQETEEALFTKLMQEQRIIDSLQEQIDENLNQTEETSRYNKEFQERISHQVYALHGVTQDKLEGMREYKNAYYQGCAFSLFLLSAVLVLLCGVLHGFESQICLFMIACTAVEGALLTQDKKRWLPVDMLCKLLYLLVFPTMLVMFVCYELQIQTYEWLLPYIHVAILVVTIVATAAYFIHDPYRSAKRQVRDAKDHIDEIERMARKQVRKNEKQRMKDEKKALRKLRREDKRQARRMKRAERESFSFIKRLRSLFSKQDEPVPEKEAVWVDKPAQGAGEGTENQEDRTKPEDEAAEANES